MQSVMRFNDEVFYAIIHEKGLKPFYAVSNYGTVINRTNNREMTQTPDKDGYPRVSLMMETGKTRNFSVHRLVMNSIHPIENPEKFEVDHLHNVKYDNRDTQLQWVTHQENIRRAHNKS